MRREGQGFLFLLDLVLFAHVLPGARDGVALFVQKLLDAHNAFDIAPPIHALACAALYRLKLRKFRFPETQYVGGQAAQARDLTDPEVQLFRDHNFRVRSAVLLFCRTHAIAGLATRETVLLPCLRF